MLSQTQQYNVIASCELGCDCSTHLYKWVEPPMNTHGQQVMLFINCWHFSPSLQLYCKEPYQWHWAAEVTLSYLITFFKSPSWIDIVIFSILVVSLTIDQVSTKVCHLRHIQQTPLCHWVGLKGREHLRPTTPAPSGGRCGQRQACHDTFTCPVIADTSTA